MRGTTARSTTPDPDDELSPASPSTGIPQPRRRQGRTALGGLPSTKEFTNSRLTLDQRKLILFLLICLVDDEDALTGVYRRLIRVHGDRDGHWCANKDLRRLQGMASKFLGGGAESIPTWDRIVDLLEAAPTQLDLERALPRAAALYSRARRRDKPTRGYTGEVLPPAWIEEPQVTVEMIRADLAEPAAASAFASIACPAPRDGDDRSADVATPTAGPVHGPEQVLTTSAAEPDQDSLQELLWTVVRAFRAASDERDRARQDRDQAEEQAHQLRSENWQMRADNHRHARLTEQLLREQHPTMSPESLRLLQQERLDSAFGSRPPKPHTLHG